MRSSLEGARVALLTHGFLDKPQGKHAIGLLRYGRCRVVAIVDDDHAGALCQDILALGGDVPIVGTVQEASRLGAAVLVVAVAPPGGTMPEAWRKDILDAADLGMSLVNPFHTGWNEDEEIRSRLKPGQWIWDLRAEPPGLQPATGAALSLNVPRVLSVGTDMAVGKMTACLELGRELASRGLRAPMVATGQVGISIVGRGVAVDAVRVDYAPGAVEKEVLEVGEGADVVLVEGQGAINHPAASAVLSIIRGCMPTHLLFVHRAGQTHLRNYEWLAIPPVESLARLYEDMAEACGAFPRPKTFAVALNTDGLEEGCAREAIRTVWAETGLPTTDPVRYGARVIADALLADG